MTTRSHLLALLLGFLTINDVHAAQEVSWLEPGKPIEREIAGGQTHLYKLRLTTEQYFRVRVTQRGVDVIVVLSGPDGQKIVEVDSPFGKQGDEMTTAIAESAGEYSLIVRPLDSKATTGRYEINWVELREATPQDRTRIRAERLLTEARRIEFSDQVGKALEYYQKALELQREINDKRGAARTLSSMLHIYAFELMNYKKAIEHGEQALTIYREIKNRRLEAKMLETLGALYELQKYKNQAIEALEEAANIYRELNDIPAEKEVLDNLKRVKEDLSEPRRLYFHPTRVEERLELFRKQKDVDKEIFELIRTGVFYTYEEKNNRRALEYLNQALLLSRENNDRSSEASSLGTLGEFYGDRKHFKVALAYYGQALILHRRRNDIRAEGRILLGLSQTYHSMGRHEALAILLGKQAVNIKQYLRSNIRNLDRESQQSYLKFHEYTYRELIDLLIAQGRLPEAEQVIRMLKEDEYFEYIRRDVNNAPKAELATLTAEEAALEKRYREIGDRLSEIGIERSALLEKKSRTPEEKFRLSQLDKDLAIAGRAFQKFLDGLATEMGKTKASSARISDLIESQGLRADLRELGKGVIALHTLVGEENYRIILTTADFQKAYEYPIKADDLNRKVLAFREVLQNPTLDPQPLAQELYRILLGPVAKDLEKLNAQMLMWSLDGVLRYVPMAALHDGKTYLVERYRQAVFTPASNARLKDVPSPDWRALGLGVTKAHGEKAPALPAVQEELRGIIREEHNEAAKGGVLPGTLKLDEAFTEESFLEGLRDGYSVVHIASHFQFQPGNETDSALLLGDGKLMSLAQIKVFPNVFSGVDLLTLSACNTATGGSGASGKEVEGFAVLAQRQGAKAVLASLWPVADRSTKDLMQEFYRLHKAHTETTKAEALRQAQCKLLHGGEPANAANEARGVVSLRDKNKSRYQLDPQRPYAHPYYWAPFILIGNWK